MNQTSGARAPGDLSIGALRFRSLQTKTKDERVGGGVAFGVTEFSCERRYGHPRQLSPLIEPMEAPGKRSRGRSLGLPLLTKWVLPAGPSATLPLLSFAAGMVSITSPSTSNPDTDTYDCFRKSLDLEKPGGYPAAGHYRRFDCADESVPVEIPTATFQSTRSPFVSSTR